MKKRIIYYDYLRFFAALSIIVLHVSSEFWYRSNTSSLVWDVMNVYRSAVGWGVAIFVMISGSIFLSREIDTKSLYTKYSLRMVTAYIAWSLLYATADPYIKTGVLDLSLKTLIERIIDGGYHMWFIPMIVGLYMCVPIFKEIVKSEKVTRYFLVLSFVISCLVPQIVNLSTDFAGGLFAEGVKRINSIISHEMTIHTVLGYSFYFILGYYINKIEFTKKQRTIIYWLGVMGFVSTILLTSLASQKSGKGIVTYYDHFSINVFLEVISVHTWFRYKEYKHVTLNSIVAALGKYSFGVYLMHIFLMNVLFKSKLLPLLGSPILSAPLLTLIIAILSFSISWVIHKIPVLKKWVV